MVNELTAGSDASDPGLLAIKDDEDKHHMKNGQNFLQNMKEKISQNM